MGDLYFGLTVIKGKHDCIMAAIQLEQAYCIKSDYRVTLIWKLFGMYPSVPSIEVSSFQGSETTVYKDVLISGCWE